MAIRHDLEDGSSVGAMNEPSRLGRYGRLAPQVGTPLAKQVRAECDRCGSHLLAVPHSDGTLDGVCPVCLNQRIHAVRAHHAAA
jgi:hypothetical protein